MENARGAKVQQTLNCLSEEKKVCEEENLSFCWRSGQKAPGGPSRLLELLLFSSFKSVKMLNGVLMLHPGDAAG